MDNAKNPPSWARAALSGDVSARRASPVKFGYHGTVPSAIPGISLDGLGRGTGAGCEAMRQVYGINVKGAYASDSFKTAYKYPMREAHYDTELYAAEAFTEDGTMPVKCVCAT